MSTRQCIQFTAFRLLDHVSTQYIERQKSEIGRQKAEGGRQKVYDYLTLLIVDLPPSAFRLLPSAFCLPPSAFRLLL